MANNYNVGSIESLEPREFTRLKPGVYCGDTTYMTQLIIEYFSNIIDEHVIGNGIDCWIRELDDGIYEIEDEGQGFLINSPSLKYPDMTILEASFSKLNTSGKYREDGTYEGTSLGAFGIGSKLGCYLSHWLEVISYRDGKYEKLRFEDGFFKTREIGKSNDKKHGVIVRFKPDEQFFTHPIADLNVLRRLFKETACLCPGFRIHLQPFGKEEEISVSTRGLTELVDMNIGDKELINNRLEMDTREGKFRLNLCMTYVTDYSSTIIPYVNYGLTESGTHLTAFKTVLTREFNKFARAKGWLKEKDKNLEGSNIQEGLYVIFNLCAPNIKYDAQVKSRITSTDLSPFITSAMSEALHEWFENHPNDIKAICDKALMSRKAAEAAKKARETVRKKTGNALGSTLPGKLSDCTSKKPDECEIFIVEGDSAGGSAKTARDRRTQAILPLRGRCGCPNISNQ